MKKGKVFGKSQIALAVMVVALGAAVWLNMKYSASVDGDAGSKYLGEAKYVDTQSDGDAVQTGAEVDQSDYFTTAKKQREDSLKQAQEQIEETLKDDSAGEEQKAAVREKSAALAKRIEAQTNIENLLVAKGFSQVLAVIGDEDVNIVVKSDGLLASETMQIQEIAVAQSGIPLANVKIIPVK